MRLHTLVTLTTSLLLVISSGCRVNSEDIETWKGTVKGPAKIKAVALADKYGMDLRVDAALALVEMDRQDVDGVAELEAVLRKLEEKDRQQIADGVAAGLEKILSGSTETKKDSEEDEGPNQEEVRAKDASYMLISQTSQSTRERLSKAIVGWFARDFNGRNLAGNYSAEQVVRKLGSAAAHELIDALDPRMPQVALINLAALIGQTGDEKTKEEAALRLVEIEKEMESAKFFEWLEQRIKDQAKERGQVVEDKNIKLAALQYRESFINAGGIPAMGQLADQKVAADRLLKIASMPSNDETMVERRWRALAALEGKATHEQVETLLSLALNSANPAKVRDYAFDRLGDVRSKKTLNRLWPLVQSASNQRERWRAGELVLAIGGSAVVDEFLKRLPAGNDVGYEPEELEGYAKRFGQMKPLPDDAMRGELGAGEWWKRVIAIKFFERKGEKGDLIRIKRMVSDKSPVKGEHWDAKMTVGKVAKGAVENLEQSLKSDKAS